MKKQPDKDVCWKCGKLLEENRIGKNAYCLLCHRGIVGVNPTKYSDLSDEQKKKANARSVLKMALRRGTLWRKPCEVCSHYETQAHHDDYDKPLEVRWLCEKHHLKHHGKSRRTSTG